MAEPERTTSLVNDLALCVINDGGGYQTRLSLARHPSPGFRALEWASIAVQQAKKLTSEFGGDEFSTLEILQGAWELEDYYQQHIKEITDASGTS